MGNWIIFFKIPPILKLEVGFFSRKKSFSQIFQNTANFFYLNFISVNFHKNQRTCFLRKKVPANYGDFDFFPPILKLEVGFFSD